MKNVTFVLCALVVFIAACTPQAVVCPDGSTAASSDACPAVAATCSDRVQNQGEDGPDCGGPCGGYWYDGQCQSVPAPQVAPPPVEEQEEQAASPVEQVKPPAEMPEALGAMLAKGEGRNNYKYVFNDVVTVRNDRDVRVKDDMLAVYLTDAVKLNLPSGPVYYNVVIVNKKAQTAKGLCSDNSQCLQANTGPFTLPFADWNFKTPTDWTAIIKQSPVLEVFGPETTFNRQTLRITFEYQGEVSYAWIDNFFGLPLRVRIGEDEVGVQELDYRVNEYKELAVNVVSDKDFSPQP